MYIYINIIIYIYTVGNERLNSRARIGGWLALKTDPKQACLRLGGVAIKKKKREKGILNLHLDGAHRNTLGNETSKNAESTPGFAGDTYFL